MNQEEQWLLEEKYGGVESAAFHADLERLAEGEPLAYVIGSIPFLNCTIYLDSKPLIPRVETEFWTEKAIEDIKGGAPKAPCVLDLCAGSGAIGISILKAIPEAIAHFGEIDKAHLPTIGKNLEKNDIDCTRYKVFQSDLFSDIGETYDYILTNPPYIDPALDRTEASVKDHEPHLALYADEHGLALIKQIIEEAKSHLTQNGKLYMEHEPEQSEAIQQFGSLIGFTVDTHTDQYKVARYSTLTVAQ